MHLWHICKLLPYDTAQHPRRQSYSFLGLHFQQVLLQNSFQKYSYIYYGDYLTLSLDLHFSVSPHTALYDNIVLSIGGLFSSFITYTYYQIQGRRSHWSFTANWNGSGVMSDTPIVVQVCCFCRLEPSVFKTICYSTVGKLQKGGSNSPVKRFMLAPLYSSMVKTPEVSYTIKGGCTNHKLYFWDCVISLLCVVS
jgi:hypothetical protein